MISIVMYALGANPTELALAPQVNGHGRQLATRRWATVKSDCDLAGGMFEPNTNNCDTFFGGSEVTCGYAAPAIPTRRRLLRSHLRR